VKGTLPIPRTVALFIAVIVVVLIVYMFVTRTGIFQQTVSEEYCKALKMKYCFEWSRLSDTFGETARPGGKGFDEYAPECAPLGWGRLQPEDCQ